MDNIKDIVGAITVIKRIRSEGLWDYKWLAYMSDNDYNGYVGSTWREQNDYLSDLYSIAFVEGLV